MSRLLLVLTVVVGLSDVCQAQDELGGASRPSPQMKLNSDRNQYKRVHQFALRLMLLDRDDKSRDFLLDHLKRNPGDPESTYMLGIYHARQGNTDEAVKHLEQAIEFGLPPERIMAGPRKLFVSLHSTPFWKKLQEDLATIPLHGPLVGNVSGTAASFWMRLSDESEAVVLVSENADLSNPMKSTAVKARAEDDYTVVCRIESLKPSRTYHYAVRIDGESPARGPKSYSFRTFPVNGEMGEFTIAFGGGAGYVPPHERMWNTIAEHDPQAILLLGDNVYIDDPESPLMQEYTYQRRQSRPEYRTLTSRSAVFTIWDDHDFGTNDCWGGPTIELPKWKRDYAWKIYKQNWPNPGFAGGYEQPGCWYSFKLGDVDFIMLDCRYYRTSPRQKNPSMLGPVQLEWLEEELKKADGTFKVICSSVPWDYRTKGDSKDTWNGFKKERGKVFDMIKRHNVEGVVLVSADRHRSDCWLVDRGDEYPLYEFNSSRLTNQHVHPEMVKAGAIFSYNKKQSFGLVKFDTTVDDPTVTYDVYSIDDEKVHSITVKRSELE